MFLQSLSDCCADLDRASASLAYSLALERVLGAAEHTNTMMWVGAMEDCPHNLTSRDPPRQTSGALLAALGAWVAPHLLLNLPATFCSWLRVLPCDALVLPLFLFLLKRPFLPGITLDL